MSGTSYVDIGKRVAGYKLPNNIWGAVIFVGFNSPRKLSAKALPYHFFLLPSLIIGIAVQCLFVFYISELVYDAEHTCEHGHIILRLLCVAIIVWTITVKDFEEAVAVILWVNTFPTFKKEDLELTQSKAGFVYKEISRHGIAVPVTGITCLQYYSVCISMAAKIAIGIALMYLSTAYVAHSDSNENLLLNSVAMLFIADIDELLYTVIVPEFLQKMQQELPPLVSDPRTWKTNVEWEQFARLMVSTIKMSVRWWASIACCGALWWSWCRSKLTPSDSQHLTNLGVLVGGFAAAAFILTPCIGFGGMLFTRCVAKDEDSGSFDMRSEIVACLNDGKSHTEV